MTGEKYARYFKSLKTYKQIFQTQQISTFAAALRTVMTKEIALKAFNYLNHIYVPDRTQPQVEKTTL